MGSGNNGGDAACLAKGSGRCVPGRDGCVGTAVADGSVVLSDYASGGFCGGNLVIELGDVFYLVSIDYRGCSYVQATGAFDDGSFVYCRDSACVCKGSVGVKINGFQIIYETFGTNLSEYPPDRFLFPGG
mgnify:CR=1 FL=1